MQLRQIVKFLHEEHTGEQLWQIKRFCSEILVVVKVPEGHTYRHWFL
jgi:hypothetical protein